MTWFRGEGSRDFFHSPGAYAFTRDTLQQTNLIRINTLA